MYIQFLSINNKTHSIRRKPPPPHPHPFHVFAQQTFFFIYLLKIELNWNPPFFGRLACYNLKKKGNHKRINKAKEILRTNHPLPRGLGYQRFWEFENVHFLLFLTFYVCVFLVKNFLMRQPPSSTHTLKKMLPAW